MRSQALEVFLYSFLQERNHKKFLLAVSGGADSMALLVAFLQLRQKLNLQFALAHIHHGPHHTESVLHFRNESFSKLQELCQKHSVPFFSNIQDLQEVPKMEFLPSSEAALRSFRREKLAKIRSDFQFDFLVFAHHADDLLETRLIRLLRGTGPQGLRAMAPEVGFVLRPLLSFSKEQLLVYLAERKREQFDFAVFEDPTNSSPRYLRNWIRTRWLPALERKRRGSTQVLAQSLESIVSAIQEVPSLDHCFEEGKLLRSEYLGLTLSDKRRVLGELMHRQGLQNYGLSHINELVKRLDVEQKRLTFKMLKRIWLANARHIWCE